MRFGVEALGVAVFYTGYEALRALVAGSPALALRHARSLVGVERSLGIFQEARVQGWVLPYHPVVEVMDVYYGTVHFAVPILALLWLYLRFPDRYRRWRNVLGATTLFGLLCFWRWPLMPPRLLPPPFHFVDTAARIGGMGVLDKGSNRDTENLFAAMPSLHLAWACWSTFALLPVLRHRATRALAIAYPLVTLAVVVETGNHYLLDGVAGLVALGLGWGVVSPVADRLDRSLTRPQPGPSPRLGPNRRRR
ncbi:MAG: phosphatase PAP2 family protein [Acidimicrobiales bacterium]